MLFNEPKRGGAGRLRHRVALQSNSATKGKLGSHTDVWTTYATVWGQVEGLSGRATFYAQQIKAESSHTITIRWRDDVTPRHQAVWGTRTFTIDAAIDSSGLHKELVLYCHENP